MLRNLPRDLMHRDLVQEMNELGFKYDFVYMPRDFTSGENRGHAFINLESAHEAIQFYKAWHRSRRFGISMLQPSINISVAAQQGLAANVAKWDNPRMKRVRNPDFKPLFRERAVEAPRAGCS